MRNTRLTVSHEYGNDESLLIDVICEELLGLRRRDLPRPDEFVIETPSESPELNSPQSDEPSSPTAVSSSTAIKTARHVIPTPLSVTKVKGR